MDDSMTWTKEQREEPGSCCGDCGTGPFRHAVYTACLIGTMRGGSLAWWEGSTSQKDLVGSLGELVICSL